MNWFLYDRNLCHERVNITILLALHYKKTVIVRDVIDTKLHKAASKNDKRITQCCLRSILTKNCPQHWNSTFKGKKSVSEKKKVFPFYKVI